MRLELMAVWLATVSMAGPPAAQVLAGFLPADLGRVHRAGEVQIDASGATATYLDVANRKTITLSIAPADPAAERARYKVWGASSGTLVAADAEYGGFEVDGVPGAYAWSTVAGALHSEAAVLIADQLVVRIVVSSAKDPAEPTRLLKDVDLAGVRKLLP
jgi:hypothetical protein